MLQPLITAALAPVLLVQGRRVRRTALELPEAAGPREGLSGSGEPFRLLVLGDSAGAGVGVVHQNQAITGRLVQALSAQHTVQWRLVARTGHRLSHVIRAAQALTSQATDLVVVSVGINDVLQGTSAARWAQGLQQLAEVLQERLVPGQVAFSTIPRIQDFPLLPQPLAWYLGRRAQQLNRITHQILSSPLHGPSTLGSPVSPGPLARWKAVDLDLPLTADFLAHDGFHPNEAACGLWCQQVMAAIHTGSRPGIASDRRS